VTVVQWFGQPASVSINFTVCVFGALLAIFIPMVLLAFAFLGSAFAIFLMHVKLLA
jgi:hypothetical protein